MNKLNNLITAIVIFLMGCLVSCSNGPKKIIIGKDACSFCKMSIADNRFGGEILTKKGKVYKFDDTHCLVGFISANIINNSDIQETYFADFEEPHDLIEAPRAILFKSNELHSPMGGNVAAFSDQNKVKEASNTFKGEEITWEALQKAN
ncbi:hypothetical protein AAKU52_001163 [Pedobacter sp. CG_S7]|uniref:nitrous oxide reductase accessory protein NosL n=1 Tax=Pedobacter sp. CG_S7 TaxID=3143930 RepID=UPI003393A665